MQPTEMLVAIVAMTGAFGSTAYIAYLIVDAIRSRQRTRLTSEFQAKLLDRVGSAQELGAFLNSEGGTRMLAALSATRLEGGPHQRILRALQAGLVLLALGLGLFLYIGVRALPTEGEDVVAMIATVSCALGVGLLMAAGVSIRISRRMGLLNNRREEAGSAHVA
jgi:hypothetical protein